MILGIHHVQLTVPPDTVEACRAFYVDRLGFVPLTDPFSLAGFWLAAGPQQVHVRVEDDVQRHKTKAHPAFVVDDLASIHRDLVGCQCLIDVQDDYDGFSRIHVIDPGGNRIELMQRTGRGAGH